MLLLGMFRQTRAENLLCSPGCCPRPGIQSPAACTAMVNSSITWVARSAKAIPRQSRCPHNRPCQLWIQQHRDRDDPVRRPAAAALIRVAAVAAPGGGPLARKGLQDCISGRLRGRRGRILRRPRRGGREAVGIEQRPLPGPWTLGSLSPAH
jgi:hypothetical protein